MRQSVHPFPTLAHAHKTALALRGLLDLWAAQVLRDHEEIEESPATLVQWVHAVIQDSQAQWDHQVHKDLMDCLYPENLVDRDQREILETPASLACKVLPGHVVLWALLDQVEHGGPQERRDHLDPEAHQGPWEALEIQVYQELLENQGNQEIQETQELLALKERKERGETLHPRA